MSENKNLAVWRDKEEEMKKILNLTQHAASAEQVSAGVVEPDDKAAVQVALTFSSLPTREEIVARAKTLAEIATAAGAPAAMVGGAPYLMGPLEEALRVEGVTPLYAFSRRESVEMTLPDGSVKKTMVFRHLGFIE